MGRISKTLLFSGGLDSFALWHLLGRPQAVYVKLGHAYQNNEIETINRLGMSRDVLFLDGPNVGATEQQDGHIPQRNLLLAATVAAMLQPETIYIGALLGETSRDKSGRFLHDSSRLLSWLERPVHVEAPSRRMTKTQLVRRLLDFDPCLLDGLRNTVSCYGTKSGRCGRCMSCFRRWVAMSNNGIKEQYDVEPWRNVKVDARYLWRSPLVEWPGVLRNQVDAMRAMRRVQHGKYR